MCMKARRLALFLTGSIIFSGCTHMKPSEDSGPTADPGSNQLSISNQADALMKDFQKSREARARQLSTPVSGRAVVVGVYSVKAEEPCHLIELQLENVDPAFEFDGFTQPVDGKLPGSGFPGLLEVLHESINLV